MHPTLKRIVIIPLILGALRADVIACDNEPPVAVIDTPDPTWVHVGYQLCFNGSSSHDDTGIAFYKWTFGDGSSSGWKSGYPCDCGPNCDDAHRVKHAYSAVGTKTAYLYVEDYDSEIDTDSLTVYACSMSWGGNYYIPVNDDDDDENGRMDNKNINEPLLNGATDDDLVPYSLSAESGKPSGDIVSLYVLHDLGALQVWEFQTRTNLLIDDDLDHSQDWPANGENDEPSTVYVEGMRASAGWSDYDPFLRWDRVGGLNGWDLDLSEQWITVVHVDMDMDGVKDHDYTWPGITEETTPGGFIPLGGWAQLTVRPVNPNEVEDENPDAWREMTLSIEYSGTGRIEVWNADKTQQITAPFSPTTDTTCWVKGTQVSSSLRDITLCLTHTQTGFQDKIKLTVFDMKKIPLGSSANLSTFVLGKVYVPTKYGGTLTLAGVPISVYYTGGSDLSVATAVQILKGELEGNRVGTGNPCIYEVPEDEYGWYYVKVVAATPISISGTFVQSGQASTTPWNGWYWPRLDSVGANLYEQTGSYTPLKDYDTVYGTTNRALEQSTYSGGLGWEGHCWGWTLAAIARTQPGATTKNSVSFNQDEMEGLYTELGDGATSGWTWKVGSPSSPIPAGPPTPAAGEPVDSWADDVQNGLRQYIRQQQNAMNANLRASTVGNPDAVWNHPVYAYESAMKEASGGNEKVIEVTTEILSGKDTPEMPSDGASRSDTYVYVLEYTSSGDINGSSANQNWKSATAYAPKDFGILEGSFGWGAQHCGITKVNVDSLYP